jgi:host factor-I protein
MRVVIDWSRQSRHVRVFRAWGAHHTHVNSAKVVEVRKSKVNRKLIRTTLADVRGKGRDVQPPQRERVNNGGGGAPRQNDGGGPPPQRPAQASAPSVQVRKRVPPPNETNAEIFYYKKQIDAHTLMVIVLLDGEEVEGTIEWYDKGALKVNRKSAPNLLLLKHNIKYMYKADERESE